MVTFSLSAIVTAYRRLDQTLDTLRILSKCTPAPTEILVHVDGNQTDTLEKLQAHFPDVQYLLSEGNLGPGGARNKLIAAAQNEWVASFDDDSYPVDPDYFERVARLMSRFPEASILNASVYHQGQKILPGEMRCEWRADFSGGACVYRRSAFTATSGYVPLPTAYGMEEVDLALRMHEMGGRILWSPWLRVFHDTDLKRHSDSNVTVGSIANVALLAYLRYPVYLWWIGVGQILNRIRWLLTHGRRAGVLAGLCSIPLHLWKHRAYRKAVPATALHSYLKLRRKPITVLFPEDLPHLA